jgi:hypothetical protein
MLDSGQRRGTMNWSNINEILKAISSNNKKRPYPKWKHSTATCRSSMNHDTGKYIQKWKDGMQRVTTGCLLEQQWNMDLYKWCLERSRRKGKDQYGDMTPGNQNKWTVTGFRGSWYCCSRRDCWKRCFLLGSPRKYMTRTNGASASWAAAAMI